MIIFLRLLPVLVALLQAAVFYGQLTQPLKYPWIVLLGVLALPLAAFAISWRRLAARDMISKMLPAFILLVVLAFSLLLVEGRLAAWLIILIATAASFISLELLFLLIYNPSRYPVNGISRVHIAYVPIAVWYAAATSSGLLVFLHTERQWHVVSMVVLGAILFRTTGHAAASQHEKGIWTMMGAIVGAHVGLLGLLLPMSMPVQGVVAALILSSALRVRRYIYEPRPSPRQAWVEAVGVFVAFVAVLSSAKWL